MTVIRNTCCLLWDARLSVSLVSRADEMVGFSRIYQGLLSNFVPSELPVASRTRLRFVLSLAVWPAFACIGVASLLGPGPSIGARVGSIDTVLPGRQLAALNWRSSAFVSQLFR